MCPPSCHNCDSRGSACRRDSHPLGQTDGEIAAGQTKLTLFYCEQSSREREVVLHVAYRYPEGMDELLSFADSLRGPRAIYNTVLLTLPAQQNAPKVVPATIDPALPAPLQLLWRERENVQNVFSVMKTLVRRSEMIIGKSGDFESFEGLYAAVVTTEKLVALLRYEKGKFVDVFSRKEAL